ncbi:atrial natriuretic peptide receptor 2-like, partial [Polypterus senegalus]|uniref:atrial natriuretic peptide receptor 2-like n=1 Tax=Polypterus senegalus TaxID=55291 RepID=UPI001964C83E
IYICGPLDSFQKIMYQFQAEGISTEDYAIFYVDVFAEILEGKANREANKPWQNIENQLGDPIELFKTVFVITYREPDNPEYKEFQRDLHVRAKEDFNVSLDSSLKDYIAGCFYDGVILYAKALNQTLADGGSKKNGMEITLKMQNQQFW